MNEYLELLRAALSSRGDRVLLRRVREQSADILQALDETNVPVDTRPADELIRDREWIAEVYAALAGDDPSGEEEASVSRAMDQLRRDEAREIGDAFATLLQGLEPSFHDWPRWFKHVPVAGEGEQAFLREDPSVKAGKHCAAGLVTYGLTPTVFHGATRGLQLLLDRGIRSAEGSADPGTVQEWLHPRRPPDRVFHLDMGAHGIVAIPFATAVAQIGGTRDLPREAARPMTDWTFDVLTFRPHLVDGYVFDARKLSFARADRGLELMARWTLDRPVAAPVH
jgi:hypothetical protein